MKRTLPMKALLLAGAVALAPMASAVAQTPLVPLQSLAPLVNEVKPAVVTVRVTGNQERRAQSNFPPEMEEFMERFFRGQPGFPSPRERTPRRQQGMGSGFIVESDGVIVTNNHVVEDADDIIVILDDGTEYEAELIGRDTRIDIAVLRVDAQDLPTVTWGDSDAVQVGDWAVAIGNPLGLNGTVTAGIVSARGRDINSGPYDDYLQVDAAINRGNSGGPLFDVAGQVIGVNTAILSPSGGNIGLGFAIPSEQAQDIVADLLEDGLVERGWIGVAIQPVSRDIAESLGLSEASGALIAEVTSDSPAQAAGLRPGDVILSFNDTAVDDLRDLTRAVADAAVGSDADIEIWRNGETQVLEISPALLETASAAETPALPAGMTDVPELGLTLDTAEAGAVVIADVDALAIESGLEAGDRVISVNQTAITAPEMVKEAVAAAQADDRESVLILVERDGARRFVTVDLATA
ncbi:MAG: Do family serine endopeptidase [Pseudomonadota bacterium]